ncbi:MAG: hypothetical protein HYY76_17575 [Acidobacteria bacterium]|nr:hypothetical protein [Acidobacteriota bacterium]
MKIDLVGPRQRGLAMGLNEFAGYLAVAAAAFATGWVAARTGPRPEPFYLGVAFVGAGLLLSLLVRDTSPHAQLESPSIAREERPSDVLWRTTFGDRNLSSATQAGLVNNLNDGMAWGLFPLLFAAHGMNFRQIGVLAAIYPGTWGVLHVASGALSDQIGRKWLVAGGMWIQAVGIGLVAASDAFAGFAVWIVAALTFGSGLVVALRMGETRPRNLRFAIGDS